MTQSRPQDAHYLSYLAGMMNQALLGLVTPGLLGVAVDLDDDRHLTVYFAVREASEQQEEIEEILNDFEAFVYPEVPEFDVRVSEGYPDEKWAGHRARQVLRMKE